MEEEVGNTEGKEKKGDPLVIIIVVVLFALLLATMGFIAYLLAPTSSDEGVVAEVPRKEAKPVAKSSQAPTQRGSDYANIDPIYPLEPFTLNLLSDSGSHCVKCIIELGQDSELLKTELSRKIAVIHDVIIRTLTTKTFEEISTSKGKERLKDEPVGRINGILTNGFIKNVYSTDSVVP